MSEPERIDVGVTVDAPTCTTCGGDGIVPTPTDFANCPTCDGCGWVDR